VGKGVCGTAVAENATQLVPDVHLFPGHIACDCASNSEIVVPIRKNGEIIGVLDIDSPVKNRFTEADKEGLEAVTEAALVLSKAAGIEVTDAAKGITTVMNQMGVSASEAGGIINSLAAGSKNGAGDVAYLQTAIEKCGTSASTAGLSYQ
jgi:hypothetical protein